MAIYLDGLNDQKLVVKSIFEDLKHPDKRSMRVNEYNASRLLMSKQIS